MKISTLHNARVGNDGVWLNGRCDEVELKLAEYATELYAKNDELLDRLNASLNREAHRTYERDEWVKVAFAFFALFCVASILVVLKW